MTRKMKREANMTGAVLEARDVANAYGRHERARTEPGATTAEGPPRYFRIKTMYCCHADVGTTASTARRWCGWAA